MIHLENSNPRMEKANPEMEKAKQQKTANQNHLQKAKTLNQVKVKPRQTAAIKTGIRFKPKLSSSVAAMAPEALQWAL